MAGNPPQQSTTTWKPQVHWVAMTMPHEGVSLHLFLFPGNNHHFCNMPCYFQLVASFSWARFPLSWRYLSIFLFSQLSPHFFDRSHIQLGAWNLASKAHKHLRQQLGVLVCPKGQPLVPQHVLAGGLEHDLTWLKRIFPNSWDDDPIWRTHIFQGGRALPPMKSVVFELFSAWRTASNKHLRGRDSKVQSQVLTT